MEDWYEEISDPGYTPGTAFVSGVGHYTALIWKSTTKLGCATGCTDAKPMYVCQYADSTPNMNTVESYKANVPQDNTPTRGEEECCEEVYGKVADGKAADEDTKDSTSGGWMATPAAALVVAAVRN